MPSLEVLLRVSSGADVRIGGGEVPVYECLGEFGRAVIHVDIGVAGIFGDGDLNRRRTAVLSIVQWVAMVVDRVIAVAEELPGGFQLLQGVRFGHDIDAELKITARTRNLPVDRFDPLTRFKALPMDFPDLSVSSVVISAWVTASKVVRVDWENWLYWLGCELSFVIWLYPAYHSSISSFCAGLSSSYVPWNSFGAVGAVFCALSIAANKSANVPVNCLNISFSGD